MVDTVAVIVGKELRQTWRDRSVLLLVFLMPLALAAVTSLAFSGLGSSGSATIGVANLDGGASAAILVEQVLPGLKSAGGSTLVSVKDYTNQAAARQAVTDGSVAAAILIPAGFSDAVGSGHATELTLYSGSADNLGAPVAASVLRGFTAQVGTNQLAVALATSGPGATTSTPQLITAANALRSPVNISTELAGSGTLSARSFFAPSMVVLALFFCGQAVARGLVEERRARTLARMGMAGTSVAQILFAKWITSVLIGCLSALVVLGAFAAVGTQFGAIAPLFLLVVAAALAMISTSALAVLLARNGEQAGTLGTVVAFVLAIIGGNFVPLSQSHGALSSLALITPNGWAIRGFADLSVSKGDAWSSVTVTVLVLVGFAVFTGVPTLFLARRAVRSSYA